MVQIAYILLCHAEPDAVIRQAHRLTQTGDNVAIHYDASAPKAGYEKIRSALANNRRVTFAKRRVRCGWGEWSLVQATLNAVQQAARDFPDATHFYMLSGSCMPIKTAEYVHDYLHARDRDFIECFDFFDSDWIKTGLKEDRLVYRHVFNERSQKGWFYRSLEWQKKLGMRREIPNDLQIMIGSQWWCLRRQTIERILAFAQVRRDVMRFFRTTWIPDETFFQTLVHHLVPKTEIETRTLTFLMFSDYGMPVTFYNDHYDLLISQDFLFARKISPEAKELKRRLGDLYADKGVDFRISDEGPRLFKFLTERGRIGQRFAPRFWEKEASLGRERELLIVACKKWHVAKRLLSQLGSVSNLPTIEYLFDEEGTWLPDLGGIQNSLEKRTRHRRALIRMLFDYFETNRLAICMDPANLDLVRDFYSDRSLTRLLEVECVFTDDYLTGHAHRVGLAGANTPVETLDGLLPTIRNDVYLESDRLRDQDFPEYYRIRETAEIEENTDALARFFSLPPDKARGIAEAETLFAD